MSSCRGPSIILPHAFATDDPLAVATPSRASCSTPPNAGPQLPDPSPLAPSPRSPGTPGNASRTGSPSSRPNAVRSPPEHHARPGRPAGAVGNGDSPTPTHRLLLTHAPTRT